MKINRITPGKHPYLQIVTNIAKAPALLYYRGTLPTTRQPSVAIIGARKLTRYGEEIAYKLAYDLAGKGVVIISGLALGIDGIAHRGALDAGGTTIAVLANSVERIYPQTNDALGQRILTSGGALISEYEPPTLAREFRFLERNRIVSGLSDAIIVVEAATRSGTLSTAARALEQGKSVFAIPGNITSPLSAGCNNLIKQGAFPATCYEDVLDAIAPESTRAQTSLAFGNTPIETAVIKLLQSGIRDGDELLTKSATSISELNQTLTLMEINGTVRSLGANQWTLR